MHLIINFYVIDFHDLGVVDDNKKTENNSYNVICFYNMNINFIFDITNIHPGIPSKFYILLFNLII
jgi:hypothetical protein